MGKKMRIEFKDLGMPVFTGRTRGQDARKRLSLDEVTADDSVDVVIPNDIYAVTSSYFLGLFGPSVRALGLEQFQKVFHFSAPGFLNDKLTDWTQRAFRDGTDLLENGRT